MLAETSTTQATLTLHIEADGVAWPDAVTARVADIARTIVARAGLGDRAKAATLLMATDARVQGLNSQFRG